MALIIAKFGGSSLVTPKGRKQTLAIIKGHVDRGDRVVVVVSAMGRRGDPYATDTLVTLLKEVNPDYSVREMDLLLSCGEIISAVLMAETLRREGLKSRAFTGGQAGIVTDSSFSQTSIREIYPHTIERELIQGVIPVVAGFQGMTWEGEVTTLGRGGSDTTATALGAALRAERVDIYTDVEGMMTGDPRMIPRARILDNLTFNEACEMSYQGARVIHSRAIEMARKHQLPVRIAGTFSQKRGSLIHGQNQGENPVAGLASRSDVVYFGVKKKNIKRIKEVFSPLARAGVNLVFINLHQEEVSFLMDEGKGELVESILEQEGFVYEKIKDLVKITIIGGGMPGLPGIVAHLMETLVMVGVDIFQLTNSHTTISVLIQKEKELIALRALHSSFGLDEKGKEEIHESWRTADGHGHPF